MFITLLVLSLVLAWLIVTVDDWWQHRTVVKEDQQLERNINAGAKGAAESESNANTIRDQRLEASGRSARSLEERKRAAVNSNQTLDRVRKARQRDEEIRRQRPADSADLSDEQLCAELTRRGIPCN